MGTLCFASATSTAEWLAMSVKILPNLHALPVVHRQQFHGGAADRRSTDDRTAVPGKMIFPAIPTRMKQGNELSILGIKGGDIRPFVVIALATCQRQVVWIGGPAMLASNDMFDMKANNWRCRLGQPAVFTNIAGAMANQRPQLVLNHNSLCSWERAFA